MSTIKLSLLTLLTAMAPVIELRGAIPLGLSLGLPPLPVYLLSVLGNMIPVPLIILLSRRLFTWLKRRPRLRPHIEKLERRAHIKGRLVRKYRVPGLILLVAIPLPGTGAWTGALIAALLDIRLKSALPAILLGVLLAGIIVLAAALGLIALAI